jgi:hypothetical protein
VEGDHREKEGSECECENKNCGNADPEQMLD